MATLTTNHKLQKSEYYGYKTFGIHFAPHKLSNHNVCPTASQGCINSCLNKAGMGVYNKIQNLRIKKTKRFFDNKKVFLLQTIGEVETQVRRCNKNNLIPAFRLNLTSDIAWEDLKILGNNIMELFPHVQFYDYTSNFARMMKFLNGELPSNYHLTFSRKENNQWDCVRVMERGGNVAAVFHKELPESFLGVKVINGLINDLRFLDPKGVIVGLLALGPRAKSDNSGFVIK